MVVVSIRTMHMSMLNFHRDCFTDAHDFAVKLKI